MTTGETALHIVVKRNDSRYVSYLLAKGADPNIKDSAGNTPLLVAIDRGYAGLVPILLKGKANPNLVGDGGQTPLIKAVLRRDEEWSARCSTPAPIPTARIIWPASRRANTPMRIRAARRSPSCSRTCRSRRAARCPVRRL